ncbi:amidase [Amylibacter sp.]|nr:amidase [Amylibacter sp.]MDB2524454.1 amidase [Amylibacter sp.]
MIREPNTLTATEAASSIASGVLSSVDLVQSCLDQISNTDDQIKAWEYLDSDKALEQAKECDRIRRQGKSIGRLHGVPVGLKDIIDTVDMPTQLGTAVFQGRQTKKDARLVERLREAGAVIMGKTVTTELAFLHPSKTRNPHNLERTPGGSSSGSAAAVAANHIPIAVGTQTNGSVIRPASFCGTYGFKPTAGIISRSGILQTSETLDQVGCFGRSLADIGLLGDVLGSYDQNDINSFSRPRPKMYDGALSDPPVTPNIAWLDLPFYDRLASETREGLDAINDILGAQVSKMTAADQLSNLVAVQARIHEYEICKHQSDVFDQSWDGLSDTLKLAIKRARKISSDEYSDALAVKLSAQDFFADFFTEYDAIIAPSAIGEAPFISEATTGDPIFCTLWTLAGLPTVTLPLLVGENEMPIGVQLIGEAEQDGRLLRTANWLQQYLSEDAK